VSWISSVLGFGSILDFIFSLTIVPISSMVSSMSEILSYFSCILWWYLHLSPWSLSYVFHLQGCLPSCDPMRLVVRDLLGVKLSLSVGRCYLCWIIWSALSTVLDGEKNMYDVKMHNQVWNIKLKYNTKLIEGNSINYIRMFRKILSD